MRAPSSCRAGILRPNVARRCAEPVSAGQRSSILKRRWGVSKAAILYRGRQLGVFSEEQYRSGVIGLTRRGEARAEDEDGGLSAEVPELIADSIQVLRDAFGISCAVLAREMKVQPSLLDELLSARFGPDTVVAGAGNVLPMVVDRAARSGSRNRSAAK